jgi:hypothetical protein
MGTWQVCGVSTAAVSESGMLISLRFVLVILILQVFLGRDCCMLFVLFASCASLLQ